MWIISYRTREISRCFGRKATGKVYALRVTIERQSRKMVDSATRHARQSMPDKWFENAIILFVLLMFIAVVVIAVWQGVAFNG